MVKRYFINYRGVTLNYTCFRMNKTQRLNAIGTSSCQLLVQNPHYNTDSNSLISLLQSCMLFAHIKLDKGKWEFLFHRSFSHNVQKAQSWGQERRFGAETSGIPLLLNGISLNNSIWPFSQGHSPCENSPPSKIRTKKKFCLLTVSCEICEVLGRHLILVGLMVFRKYICVHTLHNLK